MDPLLATLRKVQWLLGVQQWIRFAVDGLIGGLAVCCAWLVLTRLFPLLAGDRTPYLGILAVAVLASLLWAIRRRPSLLEAALETDRRLALEERSTSSLQLARAEGPMIDALHEDARRRIAQVDFRGAFPFSVPSSTRWLILPLLVFGVGYVFLPEFDLFGFKERQVQAKAKQEARRVKAERIEAAARPLKDAGKTAQTDALADAARDIERVAEELAAGKLTEKQALAKLAGLGERLRERREALQPEAARPNLASEAGKLGATREMAQNILNGRFGAAAQQARELQKKLKEGDLSDEEKKKLAEDLKKLSDMLKGEQQGRSPALSEALAKTAAGLKLGELGADGLQLTPDQAPDGELSLEDVASILEQLDKLNLAMIELGECQFKMLGPSEFCRICGAKLKPCQSPGHCPGCGPGHACYGLCGACAGSGWGNCCGAGMGPWRPGYNPNFGRGMGGPGRGRGGSTGPLPDVEDAFAPTMLPGEMTKGKFLASIVQRAAPDQDAEPTQEFITELLVEAKQEAEQALTKEEIPPGAREFVRQYFGSLESEPTPQVADQSALENPAQPGTAFIQQ